MQTMKEYQHRITVRAALADGLLVCGARFSILTEEEAVTQLLNEGSHSVFVMSRERHEHEVRQALAFYQDETARGNTRARCGGHRDHYAALVALYDPPSTSTPGNLHPLDTATRDYVLAEIKQSLLRRALISYETANATALPGHAQQCRELANELRRIAEDDIPAMRWPTNIPEDK